MRVLLSAGSQKLDNSIKECQNRLRALDAQLQATLIIRIYQNGIVFKPDSPSSMTNTTDAVNGRQERASSCQSEQGACSHVCTGATGAPTARPTVAQKVPVQVNHLNGSGGSTHPHARQERPKMSPFPVSMPHPNAAPAFNAPSEKPQRKMDHPMPSPYPSPSMPLPLRHRGPTTPMPARNDRAMEQERGHTDSSILHLKSMFPNYETAAL